MGPFTSAFATIVGRRSDAHPSFLQAYEAGILLSWVNCAAELRTHMDGFQYHDLIIFDVRYQSEDQCSLCRELVSSGQRVICIGCDPQECRPCHTPETDLLTAILCALADAPAFSRTNLRLA